FFRRVPSVGLLPPSQFFVAYLRLARFEVIFHGIDTSDDNARFIAQFQRLRQVVELVAQGLVERHADHDRTPPENGHRPLYSSLAYGHASTVCGWAASAAQGGLSTSVSP